MTNRGAVRRPEVPPEMLLRDRHYEIVARTTAPVTVERPFRVTIDPVSLTRGLRAQ
jgi:hypothetical protein